MNGSGTGYVTPSSRQCPRASRPTIVRSITRCWPTITLRTSAITSSRRAAIASGDSTWPWLYGSEGACDSVMGSQALVLPNVGRDRPRLLRLRVGAGRGAGVALGVAVGVALGPAASLGVLLRRAAAVRRVQDEGGGHGDGHTLQDLHVLRRQDVDRVGVPRPHDRIQPVPQLGRDRVQRLLELGHRAEPEPVRHLPAQHLAEELAQLLLS